MESKSSAKTPPTHCNALRHRTSQVVLRMEPKAFILGPPVQPKKLVNLNLAHYPTQRNRSKNPKNKRKTHTHFRRSRVLPSRTTLKSRFFLASDTRTSAEAFFK
jgi:hypothetical protein